MHMQCMHVHKYVHLYACARACIYTCMCIRVYVYVRPCKCMYACTCVDTRQAPSHVHQSCPSWVLSQTLLL